MFAALLR